MPADTALPVPPARGNEDDVYQSSLNACITGIAEFPVDKREATVGACLESSHFTTTTTKMDHSRLAVTQATNLAVQPVAANAIVLKKKAVKLLGPSLTAEPVMKKPKETAESNTFSAHAPTIEPVQPTLANFKMSEKSRKVDNSLDIMYERLMTTPSTSPPVNEADVGKKALTDLVANTPARSVGKSHEECKDLAPSNTKVWTQQDLEREYMRKASQYINALPGSEGTTAHTFKCVSKNLRTLFMSSEETEVLKTQCVSAIIDYGIKLKKDAKGLTADAIKQILKDNDGDFLQLCGSLMAQNCLELATVEELNGLCQKLLEVLLKWESKDDSPTLPVDNMTAWPDRENRESPAGFRTCILKGVYGVKTIHKVQALVWGGKLEFISLPDSAGFAMVRFLTAEGCQKYYEATQNGVETISENGNKVVVFVEKTDGPNSTNDVMRACADGDATRCVRAVGVDDDWTDAMLTKLARGKDKPKRELDIVKRGKTSSGHNYIEFRFANIYHALSFKRELADEEDWEHCTISYVPDPCDVARGVHHKDA